MPSFSRGLEKALHQAMNLARERAHEFATLEHLLLALTEDRDTIAVLTGCDVDVEALKGDLEDFINEELDSLVVPNGQDARPTAAFQRVIQRAVIHVQSSGREEVTGANVLVAIFAERESHAAYFLEQQDMSRLDAVNFISHGITKSGPHEERRVRGAESSGENRNEENESGRGGQSSALADFCVNLNEKAKNGKIDPLIGRDAELRRTIQVLCRR
ncbi:MAG TPA: Clp protease N-terminal domain-containing protein, partial [Arsenicitalea sp.]|nr:Clp protease N-terminal domain-containing protein [Arsenicitalea sp.]